jgi:hypothetical protein
MPCQSPPTVTINNRQLIRRRRSARVVPRIIFLRRDLWHVPRRAIVRITHLLMRVAIVVMVLLMRVRLMVLRLMVLRLVSRVLLRMVRLLVLLRDMRLLVQLARALCVVRRLRVVRLCRSRARRRVSHGAGGAGCRGAVGAAPEVEAGDDVFAELVFVRVEDLPGLASPMMK